jgi:hypothetical protein
MRCPKTLAIRGTLIVLLVLQANPGALLVRAAQSGTRSPKELIEEFVKIETAGGRLTTDDRLQTCKFFVRASPFEAHPKMLIIGPDYLVWDPVVPVADGKTQINVEIDPKGFIDATLKFTPVGQQFMKNSAQYSLVLADVESQANSDCKSKKDLGDRKNWMIDGPNNVLMITVDTARRYLESERNKLVDATIKKNVENTISQLSKLK